MAETYFLDRPCKRGHTGPRYLSTRQCCQCISERPRATPEKSRKTTLAHYYRHRDQQLVRMKRWRDSNPELFRSLREASYDPQRAKAWWKNNPGKRAEYNAKRKAALLNATPVWLTNNQRAEIEAIYMQAGVMGDQYEVDHIIPLINETVCGLHVPWNLQIITKIENRKKGNKYANV